MDTKLVRRAAAEGICVFGLKRTIRALGDRVGDMAEAKDGFAWEASNDFLGLNDEARERGLLLIRTECGDTVVWPGMRADVARELDAELSSTFHRAFDAAMNELHQEYINRPVPALAAGLICSLTEITDNGP